MCHVSFQGTKDVYVFEFLRLLQVLLENKKPKEKIYFIFTIFLDINK